MKARVHPATGSTGMLACSGDMLLQALVACAGVTLQAVATATGIEVKEGGIMAEADLHFRGTIGELQEAPVRFQKIRLHFQILSEAAPDQLASLKKLTEGYCIVYQTLVKGTEVEMQIENR